MKNINYVNDHPIPGQGLASGVKRKFEEPPEFTDYNEAVGYLWDRLTGPSLPKLYEQLRMGIPITQLAKAILDIGFSQGKWTVDMVLLLMEPTIIMILWLAQQANIDYVVDANRQKLLSNKFNKDKQFDKLVERSGGEVEKPEPGLLGGE
jgi:hypothetical protein